MPWSLMKMNHRPIPEWRNLKISERVKSIMAVVTIGVIYLIAAVGAIILVQELVRFTFSLIGVV